MRNDRRAAAAAALGVVAVVWAGPAAAQTYPVPTPEESGVLGVVITRPQPAVGEVAPAKSARTLPFTGQELAAAVLVGGAALGAGVVLVVAGRRRTSD